MRSCGKHSAEKSKTYMTEQYVSTPDTETVERGYPVDVKEEEFVQFSMTLAKTFGALRMQLPTAICFTLYMVLAAVLIVWEYLDSGTISWVLIAVAALSVVCAVPGLIVMPRKTRRTAEKSYRDNNDNEYYGELIVRQGEIVKLGGYKRWSVPLNATTLYIEDTDFMAFTAMGGWQQVILLPARCLTEDMAAAIRRQVFDPACTVNRKVLHRMNARATAPLPMRDLPQLPRTLWSCRFAYTPEELRALMSDTGQRRLVKSLPVTALGSFGAGLAMMLCFESVWALVLTAPLTLLLALLVSSLNAAATAKRTAATQTVRVNVTLTDRGVEFDIQPGGQKMHLRWQAIGRATETDTAVELYYADHRLLRIPKRCIDDMDELRALIDKHRRHI